MPALIIAEHEGYDVMFLLFDWYYMIARSPARRAFLADDVITPFHDDTAE